MNAPVPRLERNAGIDFARGMALVAVGVWAALAVAALAWTRFVGNGPMERLWRWGTYGAR